SPSISRRVALNLDGRRAPRSMRRSLAPSPGISKRVDPVQLDAALTALAALLLALLLTAIMRKLALAYGVLDVPNDRSSHRVPTPRGGGVAIALSSIAASIILLWRGVLDFQLFLALTGRGIAVAFVGFLDDRRQLSARIRLAAHLAAA